MPIEPPTKDPRYAGMVLIEHRLLTRLGGLVMLVARVLFAALRYLPPPH
jgi:hypothetical protein